MKKTFEILEWSLNLSSNLNAVIPEWVFSAMKTKDGKFPDIMFLNEVVTGNNSCQKFLKKIEEQNCRAICSYNNHGNQVAIILNKDFKIINIIYQMPYVQTYYAPDFLHVEAEYNGTVYNFVALRIRVNSGKLTNEEFMHRYIQFQCYKHYISKLTNVISSGDFNNAQIIGTEKDLYKSAQKEYDDGKYLQRFYNYQMIRNEMYQESGGNLVFFTPSEMVSSIGIWDKRVSKFKIPDANEHNNKYDHVVLSNTIKFVNNDKQCQYDWEFYSNLEEKNVNYKTGGLVNGVPDHAQLRTSIII